MMTTHHGPIYPFIPQCSHWHGQRCPKQAYYDVLTEEGCECPGGPVCRTCGYAIVSEYRFKLRSQWGLRAIKTLKARP